MRFVSGLAAAIAVAAALTADASAAPALRVLDRTPLVVSGSGFRANERVTVTVLTGLGPRIARATARAGRFRVAFAIPAQPCASAFAVRARGSLGSWASAALQDRSPCVPPPRD